MFRLILLFSFCCPWLTAAETPELPNGPVVLPLVLDKELALDMGWVPGETYWLQVDYYQSPDGDSTFEEPAEKLFWFQDIPAIMLGASGQPIPHTILNRGVAWIRLYENGVEIFDGPLEVYPRKDQVRLSADQSLMKAALGKALPGVNASYLAQVAHFLAGNLASLQVQGTSYQVSGYGEVINSAGQWTGEPIAGGGSSDGFTTVTGNFGSTTADMPTDSLAIVGSGIVSTQISGDTLTIAANEQDGDATNEIQNVFQTVSGNLGTAVAANPSDTLSIVGTGNLSTDVSGHTVTIIDSDLDSDPSNELQSLFQTVTADSGSTTANQVDDTLTVNGTGLVTTSISGDQLTVDGSVPDDSLDFDKMADLMTLDATTQINMDTQAADLLFDGETLVVGSAQNRVGIGTANPQERLHVSAGSLLQTGGKPSLLKTVSLANNALPQLIATQGSFAYVYESYAGKLYVLDCKIPGSPRVIEDISVAGSDPYEFFPAEGYLYGIDRVNDTLIIIDVSAPGYIGLAATVNLSGTPLDLSVEGKYIYIAASNGLLVLDATLPASPVEVGQVAVPGTGFTNLWVQGDYVFATTEGNMSSLASIWVVDPTDPYLWTYIQLGGFIFDVAGTNTHLYALDSTNQEMVIVDTSRHSLPIRVGSMSLGSIPNNIRITGNHAYVTDLQDKNLKVFDLSNPVSPSLTQTLTFDQNTYPQDLAVLGRYGYLIDPPAGGIKVIDLSGTEVSSLQSDRVRTGRLDVGSDIKAEGNVSVDGGIRVGTGGLFTEGNLGLRGSMSISTTSKPMSSPKDMVQLYSEDVAGSAELKVRDEAGNVTTLSPHNFSLIGQPSEPMAWSYFSSRGNMTINVDMLRAIRLLENLSGEQLVHLKKGGKTLSDTLPEGIAARLEAFSQRLERLEQENKALKAENAAIRSHLKVVKE